jgi:hypothetical protein
MKYLSLNSGRTFSAMLVVIVTVFILSFITVAQSGRRVKKSSSLPPVATPEASPTPTPSKSPERPAVPIFLGVNAHDTNANIPLYFGDSVGKSCAQRLGQRSIVNVELSSRDVTRGEAVKRAKEAKNGFVVLLELRSDRMRMSGRDSDLSQIYLEYAVFAAVTGKQITAGSVYQTATGLRDVIAGRGNSTGAVEYRLQQAAQVAAERILNAIFEHEP